MILWRDIFDTLIISMGTFLIFFVFFVLTSESYSFFASSLMIRWRSIDVTAKTPMQALVIFMGFIDLISETLLSLCCFVDDSLKRHIWNIDNFEGNFFDLHWCCCVNLRTIDVSLLLHWWFDDDSFKKHWRYSEDFDASVFDLYAFYWLNLRNFVVS